jgi:hypothetical protein
LLSRGTVLQLAALLYRGAVLRLAALLSRGTALVGAGALHVLAHPFELAHHFVEPAFQVAQAAVAIAAEMGAAVVLWPGFGRHPAFARLADGRCGRHCFSYNSSMSRGGVLAVLCRRRDLRWPNRWCRTRQRLIGSKRSNESKTGQCKEMFHDEPPR